MDEWLVLIVQELKRLVRVNAGVAKRGDWVHTEVVQESPLRRLEQPTRCFEVAGKSCDKSPDYVHRWPAGLSIYDEIEAVAADDLCTRRSRYHRMIVPTPGVDWKSRGLAEIPDFA
jgi:hypothetical protein